MQATLSARPKSIIDLAPRPQLEAGARSKASARESKTDFAEKLSDARKLSVARAERKDARSTQPAEKSVRTDSSVDDAAAAQKTDKFAKPKRVDEANPRDDAATASDDSTQSSAKPSAEKPAEEVTEKAVAETDNVVAEVKPQTAEEAAATAAAAALQASAAEAAQMNVQPIDVAAAPAETPTAAEVSSGEEVATITAVATTVVAGVAPSEIASGGAATVDGEQDAAAVPEAVNPQLVKVAAEEGEAKAKSVTADAKLADLKSAAADASIVAPTADGAARERPADADAGHQQQQQQEAALKATEVADAASKSDVKKSAESTFDTMLAKLTPTEVEVPKQQVAAPQVSTPQPAVAPEQRFAADNMSNIVKGVQTQINAGGNGQMRMRLDPPELGALDVAVKMMDGRMTATFTTSNDEATQLLSHSLNNLKHSLEASGITVDRIQVRQATTDNNAQQQQGNSDQKRENGSAFDQPSQRGDQQRKEAVEKMWRKLAYGSDELDFVA